MGSLEVLKQSAQLHQCESVQLYKQELIKVLLQVHKFPLSSCLNVLVYWDVKYGPFVKIVILNCVCKVVFLNFVFLTILALLLVVPNFGSAEEGTYRKSA